MRVINFLPWRQDLIKQQRRKIFYIIGVNIMIILCMAGLIQGAIKYKEHIKLQNINALMMHYRQIQSETQNYQALYKERKSVLSDLKTFHDLGVDQRKKFALLYVLLKNDDKRINIERVNITKKQLTLSGNVTSVKKINQYVDKLKGAKFLIMPKIQIKNYSDQRNVYFILESRIA